MVAVKKIDRRKRLDEVEQVIQNKGWSGRIARALAKHFDVDIRTVYRYRTDVLEEIATGYRGLDREHARGEFLLRLRENIERSQTAGRWGPVASMLGMEGRVLGVFIEDEPFQTSPRGSLDDVIEQFRDLPPAIKGKLMAALDEANDAE